MNPSDIENYQSEVIFGNVTAGDSSFTFTLNLPFQPDEFILKTISYTNPEATTTTSEIVYVRSDLVDNKIFFSTACTSYSQETWNTPFRNYKPVRGTYNFNLTTSSGAPWTSDTDLEIAITVLFLKWK